MTDFHDSSQEKMHAGHCDADAMPRHIELQDPGAQSESGCPTEQDCRGAIGSNSLAEQLCARLRAAAGKGATRHIARECAKLLGPVGFSLCIAAALIAGLLAYVVFVKPLDRALAREQAASLAREMDAAIRARSAAVSMALNSLERKQGVAPAELERLAAGFARTFPDFLSLEIANDQGKVLAMIGDMPLSEAARQMGSDDAEHPGKASPEMFGMDPAQQSFFVSGEADVSEGAKWLARVRFSRASIDKVLALSTAGRTSTLVQVPDNPQGAGPAMAGTLSAIRELWGGPVAAEADLSVPGWSVRLERQAGMSLFAYLGIIVLGSIGLVATGIYLMPRVAEGLDRWMRATDEFGREPAVEISSAGCGSSSGHESGAESEPAITREIEVPAYALPEPTGAIIPDFSDLEEPGLSREAAERHQVRCSAADGNRPAGIPECLEVTWDEQDNRGCPACPESFSKPGKFATP